MNLADSLITLWMLSKGDFEELNLIYRFTGSYLVMATFKAAEVAAVPAALSRLNLWGWFKGYILFAGVVVCWQVSQMFLYWRGL